MHIKTAIWWTNKTPDYVTSQWTVNRDVIWCKFPVMHWNTREQEWRKNDIFKILCKGLIYFVLTYCITTLSSRSQKSWFSSFSLKRNKLLQFKWTWISGNNQKKLLQKYSGTNDSIGRLPTSRAETKGAENLRQKKMAKIKDTPQFLRSSRFWIFGSDFWP